MFQNRISVLLVLIFLLACGISGQLPAQSVTPGAQAKAPIKKTMVAKPSATVRTTARPAAAPVKKTVSTQPPVDANAFYSHATAGKQAYDAGNYPKAQTSLKTALALLEKTHAPKHRNIAVVANLLGFAEFKLNNYPAARSHIQRSLSICNLPENQDAFKSVILSQHVLLGEMGMASGQYEDARAAYAKALQLAQAQGNSAYFPEINRALADIANRDEGPDYLKAVTATVTRWSYPEQPILVYVDQGTSFKDWRPSNITLVHDAFDEWQRALDGQLNFQFVSDPQEADIRVGWVDSPMGKQEGDDPDASSAMKSGYCRYQYLGGYLYRDDITIALHAKDGSPSPDSSLYRTTLHEVGHAIGLRGHSANPADTLFPHNSYVDGNRKGLSARDIQTARLLYAMPPQVTNPQGIHLVRYSEFVRLKLEASKAYNAKNYPLSFSTFQQALGIYAQDPDVRYWMGLSAWQMKQYEQAVPYLMAAAGQSREHQVEALRMAGSSMLMSGQKDDQAGAHGLAEDKYRRAYQLLAQASASGKLESANAQWTQETMGWINQRLAVRSVIQWAGNPARDQGTLASNGEQQPAGKKKKKHWWSFEPPSGYSNQVPVQIMMPGRMMGY